MPQTGSLNPLKKGRRKSLSGTGLGFAYGWLIPQQGGMNYRLGTQACLVTGSSQALPWIRSWAPAFSNGHTDTRSFRGETKDSGVGLEVRIFVRDVRNRKHFVVVVVTQARDFQVQGHGMNVARVGS